MMSILGWKEALERVIVNTHPAPVRSVPLGEAAGKVCAGRVVASLNVPGFTNSAMDGYAILAGDTVSASEHSPVLLRVIGCVPAGSVYDGQLHSGFAIEIMTGAPLPQGADAVVRVEDTELVGDATVRLTRPVLPGTAVRLAGSDSAAGSLLCDDGTIVTPALVGLLASCGIREIQVRCMPRIGLITSGDEVLQTLPPDGMPPGKILDSAGPMLAALFRSWECEVQRIPHVADDEAGIRRTLLDVRGCEVLVVTGGVSMGRRDYVRKTLCEIGAREIFWRVNQQPGGPLLFCVWNDIPVFGLPGNPVSGHVCSDIYVRACVSSASGRTPGFPRVATVLVGDDLVKTHSKTVFLRGRLGVERGAIVTRTTTDRQGSHVLQSLIGCHGFIVFESNKRELKAGDPVDFIVTDDAAFSDCAAQLSRASSLP